jgi:casein kinase 1 epsilon
MELIINGKYKIGPTLGKGSFGLLYSGKNVKSNELVAIKLEHLQSLQPQLQYEAKIYRNLKNGTGFSQIYWDGIQDDYYCMVMTMLGPNLKQLFDFCNQKFTIKTCLMIGIQMIDRLQFMHDQGYVHRDMKPENICIGQHKKAGMVYLIDFGLTKRYRNPSSGQHIEQKKSNGIVGTIRYLSKRANMGLEQSRVDDLFSLGYILVMFLR